MPSPATSPWLAHPFYNNSIVLGIDIGIQGIGICLRRGPEILHLKTHLFDLPDSAVLAERRQKRAWRHCRKNRHTRLHRLEKLFRKHGLPWPALDTLSKTDPFLLRHRALHTGLASSHALALAIRHCLLRRGYDYHAFSTGDFPWGDDSTLQAAIKWMNSTYISPEVADHLRGEIRPLLTGKKRRSEDPDKDWAEERALFDATLARRIEAAPRESIEASLASYKADNGSKARAAIRGRNFPRSAVEAHLREIIRRHHHLIDRPEEFTAALFLKPDPTASRALQRRARENAIFHYQRKTIAEAKEHWESKTRDCRLAVALGLPLAKADDAAHPDIRRWRLLEFLAFRRIEASITTGKGKDKTTTYTSLIPAPDLIKDLLATVAAEHPPAWQEWKAKFLAAFQQPGTKLAFLPATKCPPNGDYMDQFKDLLCPSPANLKQKAGICAATARHLYTTATADGSSFDPATILARLNDIRFFELRKSSTMEGPLFPQVRFLLGERAKQGPRAGQRAVEGELQKIFRHHAAALDSATAPDYIVIECVGDAPRNDAQAKQIQQDQKNRRDKRIELFAAAKHEDTGVASTRRRLAMHAQQRGLCPYTGLDLPTNPLDPDLELDHIFPQDMGGLSTDANLVLTFRWVNALKRMRTPLQFATSPGDPRILAWPSMLKNVSAFKWSRRKSDSAPEGKYDIFVFEPSTAKSIPDFGSTTRVAQLARQLVSEAKHWMGISSDAEAARQRLATPSGWLAAQARRSWARDAQGEPVLKNRDEPQHHLIDAYVLAHIPPAEGMNSVRCGGIFASEWQTHTSERGTVSRRPITVALPELCSRFVEDVTPLLGPGPETLPVVKHRPRKWAQSIGDQTFWRLDLVTGAAYQREPLRRDSKKFPDAEALLKALQRTRIPEHQIPSKASLARWLQLDDSDPSPLLLADGTPIRSTWKLSTKQTGQTPLGWSGRMSNTPDTLRAEAFRILDTKSEALEIWIAWTGRKWEFLKRRVPAALALRHLLKFAGPWKGEPAPAWMQEHPDKPSSHLTLEEIVCGSLLPPIAARLVVIRRGDERLIRINPDGSISAGPGDRSAWWSVVAINASLKIKLQPLLAAPESWNLPSRIEPADPNKLLAAFAPELASMGLAGLAARFGLNSPSPADDPSPHPRGKRGPRNPGPAGQADLGLA